MEEKKKKYFIRCVGVNPDDKSIDVRISGIYEFENANSISMPKLLDDMLVELKKINENVVICDITNLNNID